MTSPTVQHRGVSGDHIGACGDQGREWQSEARLAIIQAPLRIKGGDHISVTHDQRLEWRFFENVESLSEFKTGATRDFWQVMTFALIV